MNRIMPDWIVLILAFVYVFAAIGLGELLRRSFHYSQDFTRKFIHVAVGMISVPTVLLFQHLGWAIIPPLTFVVINYLDYRLGVVQAMMSSDRSNLGTVYFPLSFAVILALFWGNPSGPTTSPHLIVAALMPMTWGDALAAVVGKRIGRRRYTVMGISRTAEGSVAMFVASALATFLALVMLLPVAAGPADLGRAATAAIVIALGATVVEAVSPWGIDNLTVPAVSALIIALTS